MENKIARPIRYYPAFLNLRGRHCVVIGAGEVALRKIGMLLDCGAKVTVVSPTACREVSRLAKAGAVELRRRSYRRGDLESAAVVVSATNRKGINQAVVEEARKKKILINVVDDPGRSDFIVPSFLRRGGLTIAVSTSGMSPALARKIRTKLEEPFGHEYASLLDLVEEIRSEMKERKVRVGTEAWQKALDLDRLIDLIREGQKEEAKKMLLRELKT